jgi:transposase-like protein
MMKLIFSQHLATMYKSYSKTCLKCGSVNIKKDWKRKWRQSYKCKKCWYVWIAKSRFKAKTNIKQLYLDFSKHKQTYKELSDSHKISIRTVQKYLDTYLSTWIKSIPRKIILLIDTTYFWSFGLMIFKDSEKKKILNYKIVDYETNESYREWIEEIQAEWREIKAIVCDWRRWLLWGFSIIPTQMCQFHQTQIVRRYITKNPVLEPNKELNSIIKWLTRTDKWTFEIMLENRHRKYDIWLKERDINTKWKKYFIHKKTRSAYFSLQRNIKYLFIYQDYLWKLDIPNTTNGIESLFSHIKYKVNLHRWLRIDRKIKLILSLLNI